jgi:hypothetical protein
LNLGHTETAGRRDEAGDVVMLHRFRNSSQDRVVWLIIRLHDAALTEKITSIFAGALGQPASGKACRKPQV